MFNLGDNKLPTFPKNSNDIWKPEINFLQYTTMVNNDPFYYVKMYNIQKWIVTQNSFMFFNCLGTYLQFLTQSLFSIGMIYYLQKVLFSLYPASFWMFLIDNPMLFAVNVKVLRVECTVNIVMPIPHVPKRKFSYRAVVSKLTGLLAMHMTK